MPQAPPPADGAAPKTGLAAGCAKVGGALALLSSDVKVALMAPTEATMGFSAPLMNIWSAPAPAPGAAKVGSLQRHSGVPGSAGAAGTAGAAVGTAGAAGAIASGAEVTKVGSPSL